MMLEELISSTTGPWILTTPWAKCRTTTRKIVSKETATMCFFAAAADCWNRTP